MAHFQFGERWIYRKRFLACIEDYRTLRLSLMLSIGKYTQSLTVKANMYIVCTYTMRLQDNFYRNVKLSTSSRGICTFQCTLGGHFKRKGLWLIGYSMTQPLIWCIFRCMHVRPIHPNETLAGLSFFCKLPSAQLDVTLFCKSYRKYTRINMYVHINM